MRQRSLIGIFWLALAFTLVMAFLPSPPPLPNEPDDKSLHILAFSVLSGLASLAYPKIALLRIGAGLSLFGLAIEIVQAIPALGRDPDPLDWAVDTIAVTVVLGAMFLVRRYAALKRS